MFRDYNKCTVYVIFWQKRSVFRLFMQILWQCNAHWYIVLWHSLTLRLFDCFSAQKTACRLFTWEQLSVWSESSESLPHSPSFICTHRKFFRLRSGFCRLVSCVSKTFPTLLIVTWTIRLSNFNNFITNIFGTTFIKWALDSGLPLYPTFVVALCRENGTNEISHFLKAV